MLIRSIRWILIHVASGVLLWSWLDYSSSPLKGGIFWPKSANPDQSRKGRVHLVHSGQKRVIIGVGQSERRRVMVLGYGIFRLFISSPRLATKETWTGLSQEMEVIGLAATSLLSKYRKIATFDEFLDRLFFLGKAAVAAMLFFVGIPYVASYVILWAVFSLVIQYPRFSLPEEVSALSPGEFQSMVRSSSAKSTGHQVVWFVMFHAEWCSASTNLQPMFGALARRYADKNRRFAHVDVVAHPEVAEGLNINISGTSKQLPTLVLFAGGREICRLPTFASDGRVVRARMDERGVTKYFELDKDFKTTSYSRKSRGRKS